MERKDYMDDEEYVVPAKRYDELVHLEARVQVLAQKIYMDKFIMLNDALVILGYEPLKDLNMQAAGVDRGEDD
ncbi:MAG: hypothetical protein LUD73_04580 [Lachnospiraceae bacterium]|nr:hypothetical protein [Lachnospiraceae bacterium]